jgi:4-hydroxy-tetrahydrodipicolinate synthase
LKEGKSLPEFNWGAVLAAVVTPFDEQGQVDYELAGEICLDLVSRGCDGVVVSGTTGEAPTLSLSEKVNLFTKVKAAVGGRGNVIAGIGANSTAATLALLKENEASEPDGYMVVTPYYNKPNPKGLIAHFQAITACTTKPLMIYNVPPRTGLDVSPDLYEEIFDACPSISAVKEASSDMDKVTELVRRFGSRVTLLSGNDNLLLPMLALGFHGVVSVAANVGPEAMAAMLRSTEDSNWHRARAIHLRYTPLFKVLFCESNPVPVKAALEIQGWPVGDPRLPLAPISQANRHLVKEELERLRREG